MTLRNRPLTRLKQRIADAARRVEKEIAAERNRKRRRWYPDLSAWRARRQRYLAELDRVEFDHTIAPRSPHAG